MNRILLQDPVHDRYLFDYFDIVICKQLVGYVEEIVFSLNSVKFNYTHPIREVDHYHFDELQYTTQTKMFSRHFVSFFRRIFSSFIYLFFLLLRSSS